MSQVGPARPKRAGRSLDVERFERVVAPGATTLLRLTGRLSSHATVAGLMLVVDDGRTAHRAAPLPGPRALVADGRVEAAFAVAAAVLDGRPAFALELADGELLDLPVPAQRALRAPALAPADRRVRELEAEVSGLRERAAEADLLLCELDRLREGITHLHGEARQTASTREELEAALRRIAELEAREAEARVAGEEAFERARGEQDELRARLTEALDRHGRLEGDLAQALGLREAVEAELAAARDAADSERAEAAELARRADEARERADAAEHEAAAQREARTAADEQAAAELLATAEQAEALRARAEAADERVADLEAAAAELDRRARELAASLEAARRSGEDSTGLSERLVEAEELHAALLGERAALGERVAELEDA